MTGYVSRATLHPDPMPYWVPAHGGFPGYRTAAHERWAVFAPRLSHPRSNPLLLDFRTDPFFPDLIDRARSYLEVNLSDMSPEATIWDCTPDQIEHARRVLTRLINLDTLEGAS